MFRNKKVCFHSWKLIDTDIQYIDLGYAVDADYQYCVGCEKCNSTKWMGEYEFKHFAKTFGKD